MVVDTSVWLEIAFNGPAAESCEREIASSKEVFVPALTIYEIYKKLKVKTDEPKALEVVGSLSVYPILDLTREIALLAADLSLEYGIAMADSMVLAHARHLKTDLLTLDNDFAKIPGARVIRR